MVQVACEKLGAVVIEEIKKLHLPYGSCQLHHAILEAFKVLHVSRVQTGIDGVGIGRLISNTEPVTMILLTDGSGVAGIPIDFRLFFDPPFLGSEMTRDAFRWDQKFYTVVRIIFSKDISCMKKKNLIFRYFVFHPLHIVQQFPS